MQRPAHEPATENQIDGGNAKGQKAGFVPDPGHPLQDQKTLAKLIDHNVQAFEEMKVFSPLPAISTFMFMVCSSVAKYKGNVKPQGNGVRRDE